MTDGTQVFERGTRNWLVALAVVAAFAMLTLGVSQGAPWWWMLIPALPGLAALASLAVNTRGGWRVNAEEVYFYEGSAWDLRLRTAHIDHASVHPDSEGPDTVRLHLRDGSLRELPDFAVGSTPRLCEAMEEAGVPVRRS